MFYRYSSYLAAFIIIINYFDIFGLKILWYNFYLIFLFYKINNNCNQLESNLHLIILVY